MNWHTAGIARPIYDAGIKNTRKETEPMTVPKIAYTIDLELRDLARQHVPAAIAVLIGIAEDKSAPTTARVAAARALKGRRGLIDDFYKMQDGTGN